MTTNPAILDTFLEETEERLIDLESGILAMSDMADSLDRELVNAIFRDAHSVKAGANLLGFRNIETLSHRLENILDMIRNGTMRPDPAVTDALLQTVDRINELMDDVEGSDQMDIQAPLAALNSVIPATGGERA